MSMKPAIHFQLFSLMGYMLKYYRNHNLFLVCIISSTLTMRYLSNGIFCLSTMLPALSLLEVTLTPSLLMVHTWVVLLLVMPALWIPST